VLTSFAKSDQTSKSDRFPGSAHRLKDPFEKYNEWGLQSAPPRTSDFQFHISQDQPKGAPGRMADGSTVAVETEEARQTKPHFEVLDGLRGVAAVGIVTFHFMEMVIWNYSKLWIGHGFLAVDFFFASRALWWAMRMTIASKTSGWGRSW
jgi:hypothetical protein